MTRTGKAGPWQVKVIPPTQLSSAFQVESNRTPKALPSGRRPITQGWLW